MNSTASSSSTAILRRLMWTMKTCCRKPGCKETPPTADLAGQYPNISIWPGDRFDTKLPALVDTGWGTQTFAVNYILRDGCHACATIGTATVDFVFDTDGKFQGAKVTAVKPSERASAPSDARQFRNRGRRTDSRARRQGIFDHPPGQSHHRIQLASGHQARSRHTHADQQHLQRIHDPAEWAPAAKKSGPSARPQKAPPN